MHVCHIITGLNTGGAEAMMVKVILQSLKNGLQHSVISLLPDVDLAITLKRENIPVVSLNMSRVTPNPLPFFRLISVLKTLQPDIIQTWMYHADLLGGFAAKITGKPVIWNIRQSNLSKTCNKKSTLRVVGLCSFFSSFVPKAIICCSRSALDAHSNIGYRKDKMIVIPNGFELEKFKPDFLARKTTRKKLKLDSKTFLVGFVARFDPQKDHQTFFRAALKMFTRIPNVHFLLCGEGITWENPDLVNLIPPSSVFRSHVHLLGKRSDIPELLASLDLFVLSSMGEAFPNALGEAMACGVPCVTTDAGDAREIVNDTGLVSPIKDPGSLSENMIKMALYPHAERERLGELARQRILRHFDITRVVGLYEDLWLKKSTKLTSKPGTLGT